MNRIDIARPDEILGFVYILIFARSQLRDLRLVVPTSKLATLLGSLLYMIF